VLTVFLSIGIRIVISAIAPEQETAMAIMIILAFPMTLSLETIFSI